MGGKGEMAEKGEIAVKGFEGWMGGRERWQRREM